MMAVQHVHKWCREFGSVQVNVKDEQRSGWPSTSADPVQNIDVAVQAVQTWVLLNELRFNLSWGTIWDIVHELLSYRRVCSKWLLCHVTDKHKKTRGVIPVASSVLREAWWSSLTQNYYRWWDLDLPLHLRKQGWIDDLEASTLSSQNEVQDSVVSRESDGHCFLGHLWSSAGWFHTSQFNSKCSCLSGN